MFHTLTRLSLGLSLLFLSGCNDDTRLQRLEQESKRRDDQQRDELKMLRRQVVDMDNHVQRLRTTAEETAETAQASIDRYENELEALNATASLLEEQLEAVRNSFDAEMREELVSNVEAAQTSLEAVDKARSTATQTVRDLESIKAECVRLRDLCEQLSQETRDLDGLTTLRELISTQERFIADLELIIVALIASSSNREVDAFLRERIDAGDFSFRCLFDTTLAGVGSATIDSFDEIHSRVELGVLEVEEIDVSKHAMIHVSGYSETGEITWFRAIIGGEQPDEVVFDGWVFDLGRLLGDNRHRAFPGSTLDY